MKAKAAPLKFVNNNGAACQIVSYKYKSGCINVVFFVKLISLRGQMLLLQVF